MDLTTPERESFSIAQKLLSLRARQTDHLSSYMFPPSLLRGHPNPLRPWWIVPHMLLMSALQLRHPVPFLILVVPNNLPPNPIYLFFHVLPNSCSAASRTSARARRNDVTICARQTS